MKELEHRWRDWREGGAGNLKRRETI